MKIIWSFLLCTICALSLEIKELQGHLAHKMIWGNFVQEKKIIGFSNALRTSGDFSIEEGVLLWKTQKPIPSVTKITQDGIYVLTQDKEWIKKGNQYDKEFFLNLIRFDLEKLKNNFEIKISGSLTSWSAELLPMGVILPKIFKKISIFGDQFVKKIILEESGGDLSVIQFKNIQAK